MPIGRQVAFVTISHSQSALGVSFLIFATFGCPLNLNDLAYALPSYLSREKKNVVNVMKIEIPILAGLLFIGNELLARAAVQGVEQALLSTVVEWTMSRVKAAGNIIS